VLCVSSLSILLFFRTLLLISDMRARALVKATRFACKQPRVVRRFKSSHLYDRTTDLSNGHECERSACMMRLCNTSVDLHKISNRVQRAEC